MLKPAYKLLLVSFVNIMLTTFLSIPNAHWFEEIKT
jgi:hypothetical protein